MIEAATLRPELAPACPMAGHVAPGAEGSGAAVTGSVRQLGTA
jgi:hypothetical protein